MDRCILARVASARSFLFDWGTCCALRLDGALSNGRRLSPWLSALASRGADWPGILDARLHMGRLAPEVTGVLAAFGLPRTFGGRSLKIGKGGQAYRCAAAADRTGRAILHTHFGLTLKFDRRCFVDYFASDLIRNEDGKGLGCSTMCLEDDSFGRFVPFYPTGISRQAVFSRRVAVAMSVLYGTARVNHSWLSMLQPPRTWRFEMWQTAP